MCKGGSEGVWVVFVGVGFWVKGGFVALGCVVVEVGLGGRVVFHPRLWRLCGGWGCVRVDLWRCIGSECGRMLGKKSLNGRSLYVVYNFVLYVSGRLARAVRLVR